MEDEDADDPVELPMDGVLDLHTFRPEDVAELVQDYLDECQRRGITEIRIIHGKGKGTLRRTVHAGLERRDDVADFQLAPPERGGWGATLVTLRARREHDATQASDDALQSIARCCQPALNLDEQVALTLRLACGLTTEEIAQALSLEPVAVAKRLARAELAIDDAESFALSDHLDAALSVVYLVFSEGLAAAAGRAQSRDLCAEAIRLGRVLERGLPDRAEPSALLALMLLLDSRSAARIDDTGALVSLEDQDRSRWNRAEIEEGSERLERALAAGVDSVYTIQAAIAALHARSPSAAQTDWPEIAQLYEVLERRASTPLVALQRAAAVAMAAGVDHGLLLLGELASDPAMQNYHLFFAARAELLRRAGRMTEAQADYVRALELVQTEPERKRLRRRLAELTAS